MNDLNVIIVYISPYSPWNNIVEYMFNIVKGKEKSKQFYGEEHAMTSLAESVEEIGSNWLSLIQKLGYC